VIALTLGRRDQTTDALKTMYRALGLLADDAELDTVVTFDVDHAESVTGDPAYSAPWADGIRTDCLPPAHLLAELRTKGHG